MGSEDIYIYIYEHNFSSILKWKISFKIWWLWYIYHQNKAQKEKFSLEQNLTKKFSPEGIKKIIIIIRAAGHRFIEQCKHIKSNEIEQLKHWIFLSPTHIFINFKHVTRNLFIVLNLTSACGRANSTTKLKDQLFLFWYGFKLYVLKWNCAIFVCVKLFLVSG